MLGSINMLAVGEVTVLDADGGCMAVSTIKNTSVRSPCHYDNDRFSACFGGDPMDFTDVPWERIIDVFGKGSNE